MTSPVFRASLLIIYAIIILWKVAMGLRTGHSLKLLRPFFAWALMINALAAFVYYELLFNIWWFVLDICFVAAYLWILVEIVNTARDES